jgi:hypothetical protein
MSDEKALEISLSGKAVGVTISNALDLISTSPMVTQAFVKALAQVLTRVVTGTVSGVIVEFDAAVKATQIELYRHEVRVRIGKLQITTEEYARAVRNAELTTNYPERMKEKLVQALYESFERDMANCEFTQR